MDFSDPTVFRNIGIIFFQLFVLLSLIAFFFGKNKEDLVRFIGGGVVVLVALFSNNGWVYFISVIVAGLIIASERFMSLLLAFIKSDSKFLTHDNFLKMLDKMSDREAQEKIKEEVEQIKIIEEKNDELSTSQKNKQGREPEESDQNVIIAENDYPEFLPRIEEKALKKLESAFAPNKILRHIIVDRHFSVDAIAINEKKSVMHFIEVKTFPKITNKGRAINRIKDSLYRSVSKLVIGIDRFIMNNSFADIKKHILIVVIVLNTKSDFVKIRKEIEEVKRVFKEVSLVDLKFIFYNIKNIRLDLEDSE